MAVLDNTARADCTRKFIEAFFVNLRQVADLDTDELRTLINDLDEWLNLNQGSANGALSAAVRNKASSSTKFAALAYVALKRGGLL